jgi:hypothetical protein
MASTRRILWAGDTLALAALTLIGFATHGEANLSFLPRMAASFFPLVIAWFLLAPALGLFREEIVQNASQLWRPALTALFTASFAVVLRGLLLNAPIIPIFPIILGAATAAGMAGWRGLYLLWNRRSSVEHPA